MEGRRRTEVGGEAGRRVLHSAQGNPLLKVTSEPGQLSGSPRDEDAGRLGTEVMAVLGLVPGAAESQDSESLSVGWRKQGGLTAIRQKP